MFRHLDDSLVGTQPTGRSSLWSSKILIHSSNGSNSSTTTCSLSARRWATILSSSANSSLDPTPSITFAVNRCRHIGQRPLDDSCSSHLRMQWRWKLWVQVSPNTKGHPSPGYLQLGQVPSKGTRQIPQSSSPDDREAAQCHVATPCHSFISTFMLVEMAEGGGGTGACFVVGGGVFTSSHPRLD